MRKAKKQKTYLHGPHKPPPGRLLRRHAGGMEDVNFRNEKAEDGRKAYAPARLDEAKIGVPPSVVVVGAAQVDRSAQLGPQ